MLHKIPLSWASFIFNFLFLSCSCGILFPAVSQEELVGEGLSGEHKHELKIIKTEHYWHTVPFRLANSSLEPVSHPLNFERKALNSHELLVCGGVVVGEDERQQIEDANDKHWCVYGQLTMSFGDKLCAGTGTLISPWHVLTTGRNLYDPKTQKWAENIQFHPGRNGDTLLLNPVTCTKKAIFSNWKMGDEKSDMGIIELSEGIGRQLGWNGLLWGDDAYLSKVDPISVTGYPGDKPIGTMWTDYSKDRNNIYESQITYKLSALEGQNGASIWARSPKDGPEGFYSLGVHAYGVSWNGAGVMNIATRLTQDKFAALINFINEKF